MAHKVLTAVKSLLPSLLRSWVEPAARPVPIIQFPDDITAGGTPEFLFDKIESILKKEGAENLPVFIISITGVYRSGKSFLLNLMKTYMEYIAEHKLSDEGWEEESNKKIAGGAWARSKNSVTHGIWMWDHPFIINGIAILLIDCQGTGDAKQSHPKLDNLILYMGLQMAHVQIFNVSNNLQSTDLKRLQLCSGYADAVEGVGPESSAAIFDSLIFLVRDWSNDDDLGERSETLDEIIEEAKASQVRAFGDGIKRAFSYVTTFMLPYPGGKVIKCSAEDLKLTIGHVDEEFLGAAKKLFRKLFIELPQESRKLDKLKRGSATLKRFKALKERTVDSGMSQVKIKTAAEALQESLINQAFVSASQYYDKKMNKAYQQVFDNSKAIEEHLLTIVKDSVQKFEEHKLIAKYKDSETKRRYRTLLLAKGERQIMEEKIDYIEQAQTTLRERNELLLKSEKLTEEMKELNLSEEIDELSITREEEEKRKQQEEQKLKKVNKERSFCKTVKANAEADGVKLRNMRSERNQDLRLSLERRDRELQEEQKILEEQQQKLIKTAEKIKQKVESNVLSEEETWIDTEKKDKSSCIVM